MKKLIAVISILGLVVVSGVALAKNDANQKNRGSIENLKYLVGTWQMTSYRKTHIQKWELKSDGTLSGIHSVIHGKDTVIYAQMSVSKSDSGLTLSGAATFLQLSMQFKSAKQDSTKTLFTNLGPEFPTMLLCQRHGSDSLYTRIDGTLNGTPKTMEFSFARVTK